MYQQRVQQYLCPSAEPDPTLADLLSNNPSTRSWLKPCHAAGIPKFYRWLSERYPLINVSTASVAIPVIDNLYFDMNGIIHNCTHGNDPNRKPTETEMLLKIFDYLDKLVHLVQPQRLLFLAIDGGSHSCDTGHQAQLSCFMHCARPSNSQEGQDDVSNPTGRPRAGCAPRAKMNQQRARRFKSALERGLVRLPPHSCVNAWHQVLHRQAQASSPANRCLAQTR